MPTTFLPELRDPVSSLLCRRSLRGYLCCDADLSPDLIERIWRDPQAVLDDGRTLQHKVRCTVVRIDHPTGPFVWKHHNWGALGRTLKRSLSRSCARKAWTDAHLLHAAGIPTPRPRAFVERRVGPFNICSYQLADYVPGTSLYRFLRFERPTTEVVRHLARQVAAIWQQLDELRVCHNDFKTENLLIDPHGKVWLIDVDRMRRCRSLKEVRRRQLRDADDLLHPRNWRADPQAAEVFRREILKTRAGLEAVTTRPGAAHPLSRQVPPANNPSQLVSVLIPCHNSADTISACLESVRDMADEILVADAGSTDDTLQLVRDFGGCRLIEGSGADQVAREAWAHRQARHGWILRILPDEQLSPELGRQVQDVLAGAPADDAFCVSRMLFFRGHPLKHGGFQHDVSVRLYRKDAARYGLRDGRVEVTIASGKIGRLPSYLVHHACADFQGHLSEMMRVANQAADEQRRQGLRPKRRNVLWRVPWRFLQSYLLRFGWLDGWAGLHASCLSAIAVYLRESMLWEKHEPVMAPRSIERDRWQSLKVFDPSEPANGVRPTIASPLAASDAAQSASNHPGERQRRPAA